MCVYGYDNLHVLGWGSTIFFLDCIHIHVIKDMRVIIDEKPYKIACRRQLKTIQSSVFILYCVPFLFWIDSLTRSAKPLKLIQGSDEIFRLFSILPRNVLRWWMVDCGGRHTTLLALMPYFLKENWSKNLLVWASIHRRFPFNVVINDRVFCYVLLRYYWVDTSTRSWGVVAILRLGNWTF